MGALVRALPPDSWVAVPISCAPSLKAVPAAVRTSSRISAAEVDGLYALYGAAGGNSSPGHSDTADTSARRSLPGKIVNGSEEKAVRRPETLRSEAALCA